MQKIKPKTRESGRNMNDLVRKVTSIRTPQIRT